MKNKWLPYILILVMAAAVIIIKSQKTDTKPKVTNNKPNDPASDKGRDNGFDRQISLLEYSNHAVCRMKCRKISHEEVEEIMQEGKINYNKSDLKNARCPRYAVEGVTNDNQRVRIVYAQCSRSTTVVTVIDLETDFECHCPGDDDKYENKN